MAGPKIIVQGQWDDTADEWAVSGNWVNVISSNVKAIRYDQGNRVLWVRFDGKGKPDPEYYYDNFPQTLAESMYNCGSMGEFVWYIRKMGHKGIKVK